MFATCLILFYGTIDYKLKYDKSHVNPDRHTWPSMTVDNHLLSVRTAGLVNCAGEMQRCNVVVMWNAEVTVKVVLMIYKDWTTERAKTTIVAQQFWMTTFFSFILSIIWTGDVLKEQKHILCILMFLCYYIAIELLLLLITYKTTNWNKV